MEGETKIERGVQKGELPPLRVIDAPDSNDTRKLLVRRIRNKFGDRRVGI